MAHAHQYQQGSVRAGASNQQDETLLVSQTNGETQNSKNRLNRTLLILGITEIVAGVLSCGLAISAICYADSNSVYSPLTYSAQGIWCGAFLIGTGILGLVTKRCPSDFIYNANIVAAMITCILMAVLILLSVLAIVSLRSDVFLPVLHIMLISIGFIGAVVTFIHSIYCGSSRCCKSRKRYSMPLAYTPQQQQLVLLNPQPVIQQQTHQLVHQQPQQMVWQQPQPLVLQYPQPVVQQPSHHTIQPPQQQRPQQVVQLANGQFMLVQPISVMTQEYPIGSVSVPRNESPTAPNLPQQQNTAPPTFTDTQQVQSTADEVSHLQEAISSPPTYDAVVSKET